MVKYRCTICGYIHEGELPEDFICPLCKQPACVFEKIEEEPSADSKNPYAGTKTGRMQTGAVQPAEGRAAESDFKDKGHYLLRIFGKRKQAFNVR